MKIFSALLGIAFCSTVFAQIEYPVTRFGSEVSTLHGTQVPDPYRWLEATSSEEVRSWIARQDSVTAGYLAKSPASSQIRDLLIKLSSAPTIGLPSVRAHRQIWLETPPGAEQRVLKTKLTSSGVEEALVDPNRLAPDGSLALSMFDVSPDGKMLAYKLRKKGTQEFLLFVKSIDDNSYLAELSAPSGFNGSNGIGWTNGGSGLYYTKTVKSAPSAPGAAPTSYQAIYYHSVGTNPVDDIPVYGDAAHSELRYTSKTSRDGKYLIVQVWKKSGLTNGIVLIPLDGGRAEPAKSISMDDQFSSANKPMDMHNGKLYLVTNYSAPNSRVVEVDPMHAGMNNWRTVIPERNYPIEHYVQINGKIAVEYFQDASSSLFIFDTAGVLLKQVALPGIGVVSTLGANVADSNLMFGFDSINLPRTLYEVDLTTYKTKVRTASKVPFDSTKYEVKFSLVKSRDGTRIPVFISHKVGLKLDGRNPVLLTGYGGFSVSLGPYYSIREAAWLEMGGVVAIACVRGGGEYGEKWHKDGMLLKKQNSINDFVDVAQWLVDSKYTDSKRLGAIGISNGGLLVSAALNQRPDLFGAVVNIVGLSDMIRNESAKTNFDWTDEFGSISNEEYFRTFLSYSPLHNIRKNVEYPPVMVSAAELDDRVLPWHQYKYIASLQSSNLGSSPKLLQVSYGTGHAFGKPQTILLKENTSSLTFLATSLGMKFAQ